jgi:protein-arginine kinase activator protein McsA
MTFRSLASQGQCQLCSANPAVLEFEILTDQEHSRQQGSCCERCACNILQALAGVNPQDSKEKIAKEITRRSQPPTE